MAAPNDYDVVSSSLADVIRQSLSSPFRKECYLLLGVTSNMDAKNVICSLLKSNNTTSKATVVAETRPSQSENGDGCSCSRQGRLESEKQIFKPHLLEEKNDKIKDPILSVLKDDNFLVQGQKSENAEVHSDEEKQLDWDTD